MTFLFYTMSWVFAIITIAMYGDNSGLVVIAFWTLALIFERQLNKVEDTDRGGAK